MSYLIYTLALLDKYSFPIAVFTPYIILCISYKILSDYRLFGASRFVRQASSISPIIFRFVWTVFNIAATEWYFFVACRNSHYYCIVNGYRMRAPLHYPSSGPGHKSHHHSPPLVCTKRIHTHTHT